jgi:hypothetical protein
MIGRIATACAAIAIASSALAQSPTNDTLAASPATGASAARIQRQHLGPAMDGGIAGARNIAAPTTFAAPRAANDGPHVGRDQALMIVGGAGIVVGAIIGGTPGTLLMVGGAIAGLYGLYEYLQ